MMITLISDPTHIKQLIKSLRKVACETHPVISGSDVSLYIFYGAEFLFKFIDDIPVSVNMTKIGKRKKNIWEPYANWHGAYTIPDMRRKGIATELYFCSEKRALESGCRRIKSLAGSSAGLALHHSLNHQCWGKTNNNEIWIDSPLPGYESLYDDSMFPSQAPSKSKMTDIDIIETIKQGLRYDKA